MYSTTGLKKHIASAFRCISEEYEQQSLCFDTRLAGAILRAELSFFQMI